ncbi:formate dehydrogenase accessory sulfurtransferase FdhD [Parasporobacterium paucivorans]|uniref:FdhD protein n=1 Tax=Parasporobacterium paucivorans DSM 15970 TaxID=1122934 RepID=A0A1M6GGG6_9FIRM|nr:formate dehydrogenase accessory sulfurtransferase FdhD [Parasporobacterium paucivorans]SHJ09022.1 FdhD protein [Parasporobacterium paucivorans DSM 15970]
MQNKKYENSIKMRQITRITPQGRFCAEDCILLEERYTMEINGVNCGEFFCLPDNLLQLACGHGLAKGLIGMQDEVAEFMVDEDARGLCLRTSPAAEEKSRKEINAVFSPDDVHRLNQAFNRKCYLFHKTGAAHSVALADRDGILIFMEDVARHNALDKVIGEMFLQGLTPEGKMLIFSGRLAQDMIGKILSCGVKVLVAPGAPTLAAVHLAEMNKITMMGFVRKDHINIYTSPERIL